MNQVLRHLWNGKVSDDDESEESTPSSQHPCGRSEGGQPGQLLIITVNV